MLIQLKNKLGLAYKVRLSSVQIRKKDVFVLVSTSLGLGLGLDRSRSWSCLGLDPSRSWSRLDLDPLGASLVSI